MAKKTNNITYKVNGKAQDAAPGGTIRLGNPTSTSLTAGGVKGRHYFSTPEAGGATFVIYHGIDTDIEEIKGWTDVTLVAETDTGKFYQLVGARVMNAIEITGGEGGITLEFEGPPWVEI